jgi:hypothetical protein
MPVPGSTQKKPAPSGISVTDADANPVELSSKPESSSADLSPAKDESVRSRELGGPAGLEPTRYGDWERKGRCIDF